MTLPARDQERKGGDSMAGRPEMELIDEELARRAQAGCRASFEILAQRYQVPLLRFVDQRIRSTADAEDIVQDTLVRAYRRIDRYRDTWRFSTWIFTIARNLWIDRLRKEVPWQELPAAHAAQTSPEPLPDEVVAEGEVQLRVRAALAELPAEQQRVIELAYLEGLSHGEIAARLGLPLGTVKSRVRIAYQRMRAAVEDLK